MDEPWTFLSYHEPHVSEVGYASLSEAAETIRFASDIWIKVRWTALESCADDM